MKGVRSRSIVERDEAIKAAIADANIAGKPQAKETLTEVMQYFIQRAREAAAEFLAAPKPVYAGSPQQRREMRVAYEALEARASRYMKLAADVAEKLVGYQSPKLAHTTMVQPDPYEQMSAEELREEIERRMKEAGYVISRSGLN